MQLVEKYRPSRIDDFIGLARPKAILNQFLRKPYEGAFLFVGSSGTGKTAFADAIAAALPGELHPIPSQTCDKESVMELRHKCAYFPMRGRWHCPRIDECDSMSHAAQNAFLSILDGTFPCKDTVFLFTANELTNLRPRFLSRTRVIEFTTDGMEDQGAALLEKIYNIEAPGSIIKPDYRQLMIDAKNNVREALMNLELEILSPTPIGDRKKKPVESSSVPHLVEPRLTNKKDGTVDPFRSEACKRAWITIRANRAKALAAKSA